MKKYNIKKIRKEICAKKEIQAEREQRRNTRLGAIVGVAAVVGTICSVTFNLAVNAINIWPESGVIYWYRIILYSFALATAVIIFIDIVIYINCDLKRYNISEGYYKEFDKISDEKYALLMNDFKNYTVLLLIVFLAIIPLNAIWGEGDDSWNSWLVMIVITIMLILKKHMQVGNTKEEEQRKSNIRDKIDMLTKWIYFAGLCYLISAIFLSNNMAEISTTYDINGQVVICNESSESYKELNIEIYDATEKLIYCRSVEKSELLLAEELKYVYEQMGEGVEMNSGKMYWKYTFDLAKEVTDGGCYTIVVNVYQDEKRVSLRNMFTVMNGEFVFAQQVMKKEY